MQASGADGLADGAAELGEDDLLVFGDGVNAKVDRDEGEDDRDHDANGTEHSFHRAFSGCNWSKGRTCWPLSSMMIFLPTWGRTVFNVSRKMRWRVTSGAFWYC